MMIGTCGGAGGEPHLQACVEILREIAREHDLHFKLAVIHSEQDKELDQGHARRRPGSTAGQRGAA